MRKLFGTDGIRGEANKYPITAELALKLGKAAAIVLRNSNIKKPRFLIGKDPRLSGYMLEYALTSGICSTGADVLLVGPMPTPAIAHLTRSFAADAGIMISASHNPAFDNGIKLFDNRGYKLPDEIEMKIEKLLFKKDLSNYNVPSSKIGRVYRIDDAQGRYIEFAKNSIDNNSLKGLKIVIDCANGASYKVAPLIFSELGAEVIVLNNFPDGLNINKESGALHPDVVQAAVLGHEADIGISLDGDADRVIIIDEKGNILNGDHLLAISALYFKKHNLLRKNTVVVTHYTNLAFDKLMKLHEINVVRVKNGDRYVIEEMKKNNYNLGGEQSGHLIFSDFNTTGDGTISALQILNIIQNSRKKLFNLSSVLEKYPQILINIDVKKKTPIKKLPAVLDLIREIESELDNNGRVLVRYSGTQNLARIMVEGKNKIQIKNFANKLAGLLKKEVN
ncbi:phosphoglucosamine mutase [Candidatus Woesearchaeota archaeon]|nr:phosphoglucosamine mutase [Candidatus Woesearchaeota archaeon]